MRLPGLLLIVSVLAVAIGVEGALSHRAFAHVLANAILMLMAVESAYFAALMLGSRGAKLLAHWKV